MRFVQLYDTNWDHHGGPTENLEKHLPEKCRDIDRPCAALVQDLKQRGLLDETIVIWGGEFGRTPMGEVRESTGRNHHIDAFTMWFAGGGFKGGLVYGQTDEFGFGPVENPVHVRDIHATLLHQLGLDHQRLSVRSQGLDFRLTGVTPAKVVKVCWLEASFGAEMSRKHIGVPSWLRYHPFKASSDLVNWEHGGNFSRQRRPRSRTSCHGRYPARMNDPLWRVSCPPYVVPRGSEPAPRRSCGRTE